MVLRKWSLSGLIATLFMLCLAGSSFAETIQYNYDDMLRLTRVEYGNGVVVEYVYDNVGNRLAKTTSLPGSPVNSPPYTPSNPSPSNTAADVDTNTGLAWTCGDPDAEDVVFYDIYLGTSPELPLVHSGDQLTKYDPGRLNSLTTYYWRIVSIDNYNAVTEGPLWTFTTGNSPPLQVTDPRPSNGGSIVASNAYLSWADSGDPDPDDTIAFDIYFGTSATPPLIQGDYQDNTYVLGDLDINTTYYWKVVARDNHGATTEGPLWTFETLGHAPTILSNVTYTSDTTLTKGNGPYIVKGRLTVNQGITLTIEPGTIVKFENGASLVINGTLIARGNAGNEIILTSSKDDRYGGDTNGDGNATSPSRGDWAYLWFRNGSSSSILDHVIMKFAGYGGSGSLYIDSASPTIRNSTISNSSSSGIYVYLGAPAISGCSITGNSSYGIYVYSSSSSSAISGNTLSGNGNYDLYYYYGSSGGVITGNTINNGIYILGSGTFGITANTINYNNSYPIRVGADDVGELLNSNTLNNVGGGSYLEVNGGTISRDATWPSVMPSRILGNLTVRGRDGGDGVTALTLGAGAKLRFSRGTGLQVGGYSGDPGALVARGTSGNPIVFTSDQASPSPGDWNGIRFYDTTDDTITILDHVIMKFAGYGGSGSLYIDSASPTIRNSTISNSSSSGIYVYLGAPAISGCSITENSSYGIYVYSSSSSSAISGNTLSGNGNYDLYYYYGSSGGVITGNTINNGIYILGSGTFGITANTINYNNSYPIRVGADDVGELLNSNTLNNVGGGSYLEVNGGTISRDATWPSVMPSRILGNLTVRGTDGGDGVTTLTLGTGAKLRFGRGAGLQVGGYSGDPGALVARGTSGNPIVFTSDQASPSPGDWKGIYFYDTADEATTVFEHCVVEYGRYGLYIDSTSPTIKNSTIRRSQYYGIYIYYGSPLIVSTNILESGSQGVYVYSGSPAINGCTIAENGAHGVYVSYGQPIITDNTFTGNGNYDLYLGGPEATVTGNTFYNGIYVASGVLSAFTSNIIYYNRDYPLRLGANDVAGLFSDNTIYGPPEGISVEVNGGTISRDTTFRSAVTYSIRGTLIVEGTDGADGVTTLTIEPGAKLRFSWGAGLQVGGYSDAPGALVARGTSGNPIVFTSGQATPSPGDWNGIWFYETADEGTTVFEHCVVEYGRYGLYIYGTSPTIQNSTITRSQYYGTYIWYGSPTIAFTSILESGSQGVYIYSGSPTISGCTIEGNGAHGVYAFYGLPIIADNTFMGNGNYDLYFRGPEATVTGNTLYNGIYVASGGLSAFSSNTVYYNGDYPLRLGANDVGPLFGDNTVYYLPEGVSMEVNGETVSRDATWSSVILYRILGSLTVCGTDGADGVTTLTIEPGAKLRFSWGAGLQVGGYSDAPGALVAWGTMSEPVLFTSDQVEPTPGDWDGIYFYNTTDENMTVFEHCVVEYGRYGLYIYGTSPTIQNSTITRNQYYGIYTYYGSPVISGTSILENDSYGVYNATPWAVIDAENNWWGDASGPSDPSDDRASGGLYNPDGIGDRVSDGVDYEPWITDPADM